jgi:hypothetical protein
MGIIISLLLHVGRVAIRCNNLLTGGGSGRELRVVGARRRFRAQFVSGSEIECGDLALDSFGVNGPPMNILCFCPARRMVFVANGPTIFGYEFDPETLRVAPTSAFVKRTPARINQMRAARLRGRSVLLTAHERGVVMVHFTDGTQAFALQNGDHSTWGIALGEGGTLVASGNDHSIKCWDLSAGDDLADPAPGSVLSSHSHNIPCVDVCGLAGSAMVASAGMDNKFVSWGLQSGAAVAETTAGTHWGHSTDHRHWCWGVRWIPSSAVRVLRPVTPSVPLSAASSSGQRGAALQPAPPPPPSSSPPPPPPPPLLLLPQAVLVESVSAFLEQPAVVSLGRTCRLLARDTDYTEAALACPARREQLLLCCSSADVRLCDKVRGKGKGVSLSRTCISLNVH